MPPFYAVVALLGEVVLLGKLGWPDGLRFHGGKSFLLR